MTAAELVTILDRLEERGHRVTEPRLRVIRAIASAPGGLAVDEVLRRARGAGRATVFRTMRLLLELGIVCRVLMEGGRVQYRLARRGHHHHLVCVGCGRIEDFTSCSVADLIQELTRSTEYAVEGHWLEVYGRCRACHPDPHRGEALATSEQR